MKLPSNRLVTVSADEAAVWVGGTPIISYKFASIFNAEL